MNFPSFSAFFKALWDEKSPFAWQDRFAKEALDGAWPSWVTLPTGTGKTSLIDIAVYVLAAQASLPAGQRKAPVRIVFAVNRRIVVDEAFERAKKIADKLKEGRDHPVLGPVASALQLLAGNDAPPLEAYPLRGATYTDGAWARSATQPLVVTTTLDQIGSRLLFRGYGCSEGSRPIHAALLAYDALLLLDEAHSSRAFSETLEAFSRWRQVAEEKLDFIPSEIIQLTATPPVTAADARTFGLLPSEEEDPVIKHRLRASKPTALLEVPGATKANRHKKIAEKCLEEVVRLRAKTARRILIVVNRVETARAVQQSLAGKTEGRVEILTGSMRPLDRINLIADMADKHHLQSPTPPDDVEPIIVVATQCVEVGADFDFDALITELAPLDSLRQRFGRLNRYGRAIEAPGVILAPEEALASSGDNPDPIYGDCLPRVWSWLRSHGDVLDFGVSAIQPAIAATLDLAALSAPQALAPILLPAHLDLLCQTSPSPHHEPEPALYIHGPNEEFPTVEVVWRNGLLDDAGNAIPATDIARILALLPPLNTEMATFSLSYIRNWLGDGKKNKMPVDSDIPMQTTGADVDGAVSKLAWVYRNEDDVFPLEKVRDLRSGDVVVLPAGKMEVPPLLAGRELPEDQLERAYVEAKDKALLVLSRRRLDEFQATLQDHEKEAFLALRASLIEAEETTEDGMEPVFQTDAWREFVDGVYRQFSHLLLPFLKDPAAGPGKWVVEPHPRGGAIAFGTNRLGHTNWPLAPDEIGRQSLSAKTEVLLESHQCDVEFRVVTTCEKLGIYGSQLSALRSAARHHDLGKGDPRFQAWLHGCGPWSLFDKPLIAKSQYHPSKKAEFKRLADVPDEFRHELLSTLIVAASAHARSHPEQDLLLHLIASHHGGCRAFAAVIPDKSPEDFDSEVDGEKIRYTGRSSPLAHVSEGVPERFWKLTRRFGWWGLAYLETILRLADQQASARPGRTTH